LGQNTPVVVRRIQGPGLSIDFIGRYLTVLASLFSLGYWFIAALLLWRKSDDRVALLAAVSLALFPLVFNTGLTSTLPSPWLFLAHCLSLLGILSGGLFFLVFPSGHFVPSFMRWVFVVGIIYWGFELFFPFAAFNPFSTYPVLGALIFIGLLGSAVVVQLYRYRRVSSPAQRQQTKWVVYGASMGWGGYLVLFTLSLVFPALFQTGSLVSLIAWAAVYGLGLLFPLSLGVALVHSRLWDIDVLINRTLVYGSLTALLVGLYIGLILALQVLVQTLTGVPGQQPLVIVASTLVIAALFQPLRRRIQNIIDRRFYRRKYDAAKVVAAFSATLRQEVDLNELSEQILAVVQETMQPTHVSLWLRPPDQSRARNTRVLPRLEEEESIVP
jgi:flagellar biosynthesis protein FliQ